MRKPQSSGVLLVNPPLASPAMPAWSAVWAAAELGAEIYDANLDFFLQHLLTPAQAEQAAVLAGGDFYEPECCLAAVKAVRQAQAGYCRSLSPWRMSWGDLSHPAAHDPEAWSRAIDTDSGNPFLGLWQGGLRPRLEQMAPAALIFAVDRTDQLPAALTLARQAKALQGSLRIALLGPAEFLLRTGRPAEARLRCGDRGALLRFAGAGAESRKQGRQPPVALPAEGYLTPAPVLAIGVLGEPGAGLPEPARAWTRIRETAFGRRVKHLLLNDPRMTISYLGKLLAARLPEEPRYGLGVQCRLGDGQGLEMLEQAREAGLRMILWHQPAGPLNPLTRGLWRLAKAGIWNHLLSRPDPGGEAADSLLRFAAANPNVIHSWSLPAPSAQPQAGTAADGDPPAAGYGQVPALPGRPLWQALPEQAYLLLYLGRHGTRQVMRWRKTESGHSVYTVGGKLEYHFVRPAELPAGYLDLICRMVEAGGSVGGRWVRHNLEKAFLIGYVEEHGRLVANSSLKRPRPEYVERVSEQSGIDLLEYLERGYTSVRPEYRGLGIGTKLLEGLTARAEGRKIFSVIGADNIATQKIALRNRTRQVAAFHSEALGKEIGVWIPEHMLED